VRTLPADPCPEASESQAGPLEGKGLTGEHCLQAALPHQADATLVHPSCPFPPAVRCLQAAAGNWPEVASSACSLTFFQVRPQNPCRLEPCCSHPFPKAACPCTGLPRASPSRTRPPRGQGAHLQLKTEQALPTQEMSPRWAWTSRGPLSS